MFTVAKFVKYESNAIFYIDGNGDVFCEYMLIRTETDGLIREWRTSTGRHKLTRPEL